MRRDRALWGLWLALLLAGGCASMPERPAPGLSSVFGEIKLVPHEGVTPGGGGGSYGDRRLRDVSFVDYSRPGYTVVYAEGAPPRDRSQLAIRAGSARVRVEPPRAAVGLGGTLAIRNETDATHVLSIPSLGLLHRLEPEEVAEIAADSPGRLEVFLVDASGAQAVVFVAPGPYTVASPSGHYELADLHPGRHRIGVWHPRFPPASRWVDLPADSVVRLDLELGVQGLPAAGDEHALAP